MNLNRIEYVTHKTQDKTMSRQREENIMGWIIIMMIALSILATCQTYQNKVQQAQETQQ